MLQELSIHNFAIIPSLTVSFDKGLNVLTGETGAGKSIIIDAVSILLGGRASADFIRHGQSKAVIEGMFDVDGHEYISLLLHDHGIDLEDSTLILSREIHKQGKNVCRANGKMITVTILKELGQQLVDIYGQHEHQTLLRENMHILLLDAYGKNEIESHKDAFQQKFRQLKEVEEQINIIIHNEQDAARRQDILKFQVQEIEKAHLKSGEDIELEQEKQIRTHARKIYEGVSEAYESLYGEERVLEWLGQVMNELEALIPIDEHLRPIYEQIQDAYYQVEDSSQSLREYRDGIEFDPDRLHEIEDRLALIDTLKRKYGHDVAEVLAFAEQSRQELDELEHHEERIEELQQRKKKLVDEVASLAKTLTQARTAVAAQLNTEIKEELHDLYMNDTQVNIQIQPLNKGFTIVEAMTVNHLGADHVQFLIAPNPGEPLKPLAKTASGGELSRFMLAVKTVFAKVEPVMTLIFDEVDTGVSGRVSAAMAEKLYTISKDQQVLCITHQTQVAALSDQHYRIVKEVAEGQTSTRLIPLSTEEKKDELARMMSGESITATTAQHASELVRTAEAFKQNN